jgi:multidrug resistance efflux pump
MSAPIFRKDAIEHATRARGFEGGPLRMSPRWVKMSFWMIVALALVAVAYSFVGKINEYAVGPAVVRVKGAVEVTATSQSIVASVEVNPGQHIEAGQVLVRFHESQETAELDRLNREFELELVKVLRDPQDPSAKQSLTTLSASRELARRRVEERTLRAPQGGVVGDVRIRSGQALQPGDVVVSIVGEGARYSLVAVLPGHYRPMLQPGMDLRLELAGYRYAYMTVKIESIGDEVVGPTEVKRFLGQQLADTVQVGGPAVLVEATLPVATFESDGQKYNFFDGMHGSAEARVRSERIILSLVPALKKLLGREG